LTGVEIRTDSLANLPSTWRSWCGIRLNNGDYRKSQHACICTAQLSGQFKAF
jgi:hypothetical protein